MVILAGPGSGKTATLTVKIMTLLQEIKYPQGLACVTFNNDAVIEFRDRLKKMGLQLRRNIFLGTFHSFCMWDLLRPFGRIYFPNLPFPLKIASNEVRLKCFKKAQELTGYSSITMNGMQISRRKKCDTDFQINKTMEKFILCYISLLRHLKMIDFDDLTEFALKLMQKPLVQKIISAKYPWFLIDEYQDLGPILHQIVIILLTCTNTKICAVGDMDQSIYKFMGADPKYIQELSNHEKTRTIHLRLNYRCCQKIIDGSLIILQPSETREYVSRTDYANAGEIKIEYKPKGFNYQIKEIIDNILPQLHNLSFSDREIALLYLDETDAKKIIPILNAAKIKFQGSRDLRYKRTFYIRWLESIAKWVLGHRGGTGIYFHELVKTWLYLLELAGKSINTTNRLKEIQNFYRVIVSRPNLNFYQWVESIARSLKIISVLKKGGQFPDEVKAFRTLIKQSSPNQPLAEITLEEFAGYGKHSDSITLTTLHSSKGLEFDAVIIPGLEQGRLPHYKSIDDPEERRKFYVGFTRPRKYVYVLYSGWYEAYGKIYEKGPSQFITELLDSLNP